MRLPDPFSLFQGGILHRLDIKIAESVTGVPNRSISRHMAQPMVRSGVTVNNAVVIVHVGLIAAAAVGGLALASRLRRAR